MSEGSGHYARSRASLLMLQWGRHQSMSEGWRCRCERGSGSTGFNGADISRCRRAAGASLSSFMSHPPLQWGRHQSMSEGGSRGTSPARIASGAASMGPTSVDVGGAPGAIWPGTGSVRSASMGPTSVDVGGNKSVPANAKIIMGLQWGRHQSMSEGPAAGLKGCASKPSFNGADISRCRRASRQSALRW